MEDTPCKCALRCFEKVSAAQRTKLFDGFWSVESFDVQNTYLCGCVQIHNVARRYTSRRNESRRQFTRLYYVKNGAISIRICKVAFLKIHGVSNGRLGHALKAQEVTGGTPHSDQRGKHPPANKTSDGVIDGIKAHINSFPHYKSHYSRKDNPHKKFLSPHLNVQKMYRLYKEKCEEDDTRAASEWVYRRVFNESFNLSFGK